MGFNSAFKGLDGFGDLVVSMLASGTRVRGFKPGRRRWIFRASEKSSACLPSKGKWKNLSHVPALRHVKEPSTSVNYECASEIHCIVPSFASRGLLCLCGAWRLWRWMRGTHWGQGYNRPTGCSAEKAPHATFNFNIFQLIRTKTEKFLTSRHVILRQVSLIVPDSRFGTAWCKVSGVLVYTVPYLYLPYFVYI